LKASEISGGFFVVKGYLKISLRNNRQLLERFEIIDKLASNLKLGL
jgi:hypothetical protein